MRIAERTSFGAVYSRPAGPHWRPKRGRVLQPGSRNTLAGLDIHQQQAVSGCGTLRRGHPETRNCPSASRIGLSKNACDCRRRIVANSPHPRMRRHGLCSRRKMHVLRYNEECSTACRAFLEDRGARGAARRECTPDHQR